MSVESRPIGRRERNKQEKLGRIVEAARGLFAEHGVEDVTTQQIADRADIGAGTLFLYVKSKSELLLLVQNSAYAKALARGKKAAAASSGTLEAIMAILRPVIDCNRTQIDNGQTYLREMVFGDPTEPHHREALEYSAQTQQAIAEVLQREGKHRPERSALLAHAIIALMFFTLTTSTDATLSNDEVASDLRGQVQLLLEG